MKTTYRFPKDLGILKTRVLKAIAPIMECQKTSAADDDFLFKAQRTAAGNSLPHYYLCYFLLVDLLGFKNLGQFEKVSWSVPIDYKGTAFLIEHRKMGLGVFAQDAIEQESEAGEIVKRICRAVKMALPYFEWRASEAAKQSLLNVKNHHSQLYDKLNYFVELYKQKAQEAEARKDERTIKKHGRGTTISFPAFHLRRNAEWLALSALDSFFSWTEHVFIHMAILKGKAITGEDVADLADNDWAIKFKAAIDIDTDETKYFYDQLVIVKRQLRNYMTHGAFGKKGEAFSFHSGTGAVPLLLPHQKDRNRFSFYGDLGFDEQKVIDLIDRFIVHLWAGVREPARIYIESGLPLILTLAKDGTYNAAMSSSKEMKLLVDRLSYEYDRSLNMDW